MGLEQFIEGAFHKGKHDNIVYNLQTRLNNSGLYDTIIHCAEYSDKSKNLFGEADLIAIAGDRMLLFEVKSSNTYKNKKKAIFQLNRTETYVIDKFKKNYNFYKFYVSGYPQDNRGMDFNIQRIINGQTRGYNKQSIR